VQDIIPGAPLRVLVLDTSDTGPRWLTCSVSIPGDTKPAIMEPGGRRYADWAGVTRWVAEQVGRKVSLIPLSGTVWRIDENGQSR
jgi:hypothetical protein